MHSTIELENRPGLRRLGRRAAIPRLLLRCAAIAAASLLGFALPGVLHAAGPDKAALGSAEKRLRAALDAGDAAAVGEAVGAVRIALGDQLGKPEGGEPRRTRADGLEPPSAESVDAYLRRYRERNAGVVERYLANVREPTRLTAGLRQLAVLIIADAQCVDAGVRPREALLAEIVRAADALCSVQRANGLFPFPDLRATNAFFGRMLREMLTKHPDALVDGWLVSDGGRGDLQYDNGLCGVALLEAHRLAGDARHLAAARRAAAWARTQPIVTNWNYNSFTVWFLARLANATGERAWHDEALRRCRLGMLPGQMENGRWLDPHNAKLVYHAILCRALVELSVSGARFGAPDAAVERAARLGLDNAADEILGQGVSVVTVPTETFSLALVRWRDDARWRRALHVLAAVALKPGASESEIGLYAAAYLDYAARQR